MYGRVNPKLLGTVRSTYPTGRKEWDESTTEEHDKEEDRGYGRSEMTQRLRGTVGDRILIRKERTRSETVTFHLSGG